MNERTSSKSKSRIAFMYDAAVCGKHRASAAVDIASSIVGIAVSSKKDQFKKKVGRDVALYRMQEFGAEDIVLVLPKISRRDGEAMDNMLGLVGDVVWRLCK